MTLSILIWLPLVFAVLGAIWGDRVAPRLALLGSLAALADRDLLRRPLRHRRRAAVRHRPLVDLDARDLLLARARRPQRRARPARDRAVRRRHTRRQPARAGSAPAQFYLWLGAGETAVLGAFCAQDLILFVAFFDLMLIPFYFLTGIWGAGERTERVRATTKLVIYTLVGSLLMLVAAVATGVLDRAAARRPTSPSRSPHSRDCRSRPARRSGSSSASRPPSS